MIHAIVLHFANRPRHRCERYNQHTKALLENISVRWLDLPGDLLVEFSPENLSERFIQTAFYLNESSSSVTMLFLLICYEISCGGCRKARRDVITRYLAGANCRSSSFPIIIAKTSVFSALARFSDLPLFQPSIPQNHPLTTDARDLGKMLVYNLPYLRREKKIIFPWVTRTRAHTFKRDRGVYKISRRSVNLCFFFSLCFNIYTTKIDGLFRSCHSLAGLRHCTILV